MSERAGRLILLSGIMLPALISGCAVPSTSVSIELIGQETTEHIFVEDAHNVGTWHLQGNASVGTVFYFSIDGRHEGCTAPIQRDGLLAEPLMACQQSFGTAVKDLEWNVTVVSPNPFQVTATYSWH